MPRGKYEIQLNGKFKNGKPASLEYQIAPNWDQFKQKRERMKLKRRCINCGEKLPADSLATKCHKCLEKEAKRMRSKRKDANKNGICIHCLKPLSPEDRAAGLKNHRRINWRCV
jgi:hypothetical protein